MTFKEADETLAKTHWPYYSIVAEFSRYKYDHSLETETKLEFRIYNGVHHVYGKTLEDAVNKAVESPTPVSDKKSGPEKIDKALLEVPELHPASAPSQ